jgi:very-short-patch-repair endonuclease
LRYRLDFALVNAAAGAWLAVEVDGHEHHSAPEQVQYDRQRERALVACGWTVMRFTGSEVWRDAAACAAEVIEMLQAREALRVGGLHNAQASNG